MATTLPQPMSPGDTDPEQKLPSAQPGVTAPAEDAQPQQGQYGPNNESLNDSRPDLVRALYSLIEEQRVAGIVARRHEIRRIRQARYFWQGIQYAWWNEASGDWQLPNASGQGLTLGGNNDTSRFQYTTNIYQGFGLSFIALISQDVPSVRFFPQSTQHSVDITTAKVASDVVELVEQNNKVGEMLTGIGYYLWTDGKLGSYVRYIVDGERFGFKNENNIDEGFSKIGEDQLVCPQCGAQSPVPDPADLVPPTCPQCGELLGPDNLKQAEMAPVPQVSGQTKVPNGQEVITIAGGLELNTPVWAREQYEFPYLQWQLEVHRAKLKATYPHAAEKITQSSVGGAEDVYARASRLSLAQGLPYTHPGDTLTDLTTFLRTWLRPWIFYAIEDKKVREELLQLYPDGCYCAFAGDTYCESRNENMDDFWRVMHAMPGEGQSRPSIGDSIIDIQEQFNDYANIQAETHEFGIPPIYADPQVLDFDQLASTVAEPAAHYPARAKPGQALSEGFFQPAPATVAADMPEYMQWLMGDLAQFLTGMFPAVFGGEMSGNKTASGYAMARDQAMGRLGMVWRRLKEFYAETMMLSVDCFRKNRPDDVANPMLGADNEYEEKIIRLADLRGNIQARAEADETFPRLKSQQRAVLQQLMESEDPFIGQVLSDPANLTLIRGILGLTDFTIPGEDSRTKQLKETELMMQGQPIPIDPLLDDNAAEFAECKRWASAEEGQLARIQNPQGFMLVRQHALEHQMAVMAAMMPPPGAGVAAPPPGENPPADPQSPPVQM